VNTTLPTGVTSSTPSLITAIGGTVYFRATEATMGLELWKTDGTAGGTVMVSDIFPGTSNSSPANLRDLGGTLVFSASSGTVAPGTGTELWKSDGTAGGTGLVRDVNPGAASSSPGSLTVVKGVLYFPALTAANGRELWRSDGTAAGTTMIRNLNPGAVDSLPHSFTLVGGGPFFYFSAFTAPQGASYGRATAPARARPWWPTSSPGPAALTRNASPR